MTPFNNKTGWYVCFIKNNFDSLFFYFLTPKLGVAVLSNLIIFSPLLSVCV